MKFQTLSGCMQEPKQEFAYHKIKMKRIECNPKEIKTVKLQFDCTLKLRRSKSSLYK